MILQKIIFALFLFTNLFYFQVQAAPINYEVTPIKYELDAQPGEIITRKAQIKNKGTTTVTLTTGKSDFQPNGTGGVPQFVRKSELVYPNQQLSTWITIDTPTLTLAPQETKSITFTVDVPTTATPGWHYWAVFFKNPNGATGWGQIGINVDYWVLILVDVAWEKKVDVNIWDVVITDKSWWGWGGWWSSTLKKDNCPFGDLTKSNFDGKCLIAKKDSNDNRINIDNQDTNGSSSSGWVQEDTTKNADDKLDYNDLIDDNFEIDFTLPIENKWNTHVKPVWKITLLDESWKYVKKVWKKVIENDFGAVVKEEIVDYLPLNDEWWNVLPQSQRNYTTIWKGFPYVYYDEEQQKEVIRYRTPWEYYTMRDADEKEYMQFWQRKNERREEENIEAIIEITYQDENGEDVSYNAAEEFDIAYTRQYIWMNPYVVLPIFLGILLAIFFWLFLLKKDKKCINRDCRKNIPLRAKVCKYCDTVQEKEYYYESNQTKNKDLQWIVVTKKKVKDKPKKDKKWKKKKKLDKKNK